MRMTKEQRAEKKVRALEAAAHIAKAHKEASDALQNNQCPMCKQGVRVNTSLAGWVQCEGFGAEGFRKDGSKKCSWQGFWR